MSVRLSNAAAGGAQARGRVAASAGEACTGHALVPPPPARAVRGADAQSLARWSQAWSGDGVTGLAAAPAQQPTAAADLAALTASAAGSWSAQPLASWRGLHAARRMPLDGDPSEVSADGPGGSAAAMGGALAAPGQLAANGAQALPPGAMTSATGATGAAGAGAPARDELHALVERCCARLLVQAPVSGPAQAVLLQLQGGLAGCAIEVQRAHGALRLTLRAASGERRERLAEGMAALGDELARALGCAVVLAVDDALEGGRP